MDNTQVGAGHFRTSLVHGISTYRASRSKKLWRGHVKLVYSKLVELVARTLKISIKRRATLFWGQKMTVVYPESISMSLSRYGFFEERMTKTLMEYLEPNMIFLDVGAHLGYYTLLGSWLVGDTGQVHSFEPTASAFEVLHSNNLQPNNVWLNHIAVGAGEGTATLKDYGPAFSDYNSIYQAKMEETPLVGVKSTTFQIATISLDEYVAKKGITPSFVSIDARSSEYEILKGMENIIQESRPIISITFGDMDIDGGLSSRDLILYLENKGYTTYEFSGIGFIKHSLKERYGYDNILFLPKS